MIGKIMEKTWNMSQPRMYLKTWTIDKNLEKREIKNDAEKGEIFGVPLDLSNIDPAIQKGAFISR